MARYKGLIKDSIIGGGSYVSDKGFGQEVYNFVVHNKRVYGAVYTGKGSGINIEKLGASKGDDSIDSVTVIWVARSPSHNEVRVVGWYLKATVYRKWQDAPSGAMRLNPTDGSACGFLMETTATDAYCLHKSERTLTVPTGLAGLGTSNLWLCDATGRGRQFVKEFKNLYKVT